MEPNNLNEWWGGQPDGLKQAFSLFPDGRWKEADLYLRINIRNYCLLKKGGLLPEDKDRSMLSEIVCELADTELCRANGKTLEDMCDTDGAFLEEYQELFNRIYDELEMRITDYMNGQSKKIKQKCSSTSLTGIPSWLLIWNWSRMRRMYISPCQERTKTGMKTMTVSMWSAGLKTFIFPAGSIHAGFSREKVAERKPPPIAGTGLRIRFKVRKEEPSSI